MLKLSGSIVLVFASAAVAACSGPEAPLSAAGMAQLERGEQSCVKSFQRQRECGETFLPALVELRVKLDKPGGIAATDKKEGRAALVATAREEWKEDSTDSAIQGTCRGMINDGPALPQLIGAMDACLARSGCEEFVPCQITLIEKMMLRQ